MHVLGQTGVSNDNFSIIQNVVADQAVKEFEDFLVELLTMFVGNFLNVSQGFGEAVIDFDVFAAQLSYQLGIVVAGNTNRVFRAIFW